MSSEALALVRQHFERWQRFLDSPDLSELDRMVAEDFADDVWVDFGTRTVESVPGHGVNVIRRWAAMVPKWHAAGARMRYDAEDFIDADGVVVVPCRVTNEADELGLATHLTYAYRVADGKIVSLTLHETLDEALAAAAQQSSGGPPPEAGQSEFPGPTSS